MREIRDAGDPDREVVPGDRLPDGRIADAPNLLSRRRLLAGGAALVGAGFAAGRLSGGASAHPPGTARVARPRPAGHGRPPAAGSWEEVRAQFAPAPGQVQLDGFVLGLPPRAVRAAIADYRRRLDSEGAGLLERDGNAIEEGVRQAAARYMATQPELVALTDSTTMGLGLVYGGALLKPGDELLTGEHEFYATYEAMRFAAARTGARLRRVRLYDDPPRADPRRLVDLLIAAVTPRTRMIGTTWVHSSTGLRFPVRDLAERLKPINRARTPSERVLLVVDGVHGLGVRPEPISALGCDVFVSGTHKWLWGPRGTGVVWARRDAWRRVAPVIPSFDPQTYEAWRQGHPFALGSLPWSAAMSPGGFHSFENRWALAEAFDFHRQLGRARVARRIETLTERLRAGLQRLPRVRIVSPEHPVLRSSIVCFEIDGVEPRAAVDRLLRRGIRISVTPYPQVYLRAGCPLWLDEADVDRALAEIAAM